MTLPNPQKHVVSRAVLTPSKLLPITAARPVTAAVLKPHVTKPRQDKFVVTKPHSPPRRHINHSPSLKASSFSLKVTAVKVSQGNLQHALKNKEVIDSGCLRHMTWNMSYLSDFKELNGGYVAFGGNPKGDYEEIDRGFVAFGGNPKGGRITGKELEDITYSDDEEDVGAEADFINFETIITFSPIPTTRVYKDHLVTQIIGDLSSATQTRSMTRVAKDQGKKYESEVHVSLSNSTQSKKHDDKTRREAKGKSHVESLTGYRNLSAKFEDFYANSINEVNVVDSPVPAVRQIFTNNTDTFSAAGPSNAADSPTHGKSSYMDTF
nr:hypothetical protein [Tanacetum cinerariifolium]